MSRETDRQLRFVDVVQYRLRQLNKLHKWFIALMLVTHGIDAAWLPFRCETDEQESRLGRESTTECSGLLRMLHTRSNDLHDTNGTDDPKDDFGLRSWSATYLRKLGGVGFIRTWDGSETDPSNEVTDWYWVSDMR